MGSLKRLAAHEVGDGEEDECGLFRQSKRRRSFLNAVREVMKLQSMQCLFLELEPFLRKVVQEEVQKAISRYVYLASRPLNKIQAPVAVRWRLSFKTKLPETLFTGSRIESEDNAPVQLVIEDSSSGMIITSGILSSVRVEIVVLDGDFCADEQDDWTQNEFNDSVVREREGKRPLLTGDLVIALRGGVGSFGAVTFTDNSSWIRSRKFRLGARILPNNYTEERIQEAISGTFFVKDHRGELYKKHHPPSLNDDVWRLEKIGKDGAFHKRLSKKGIRTVQDFLKFLVMDQDQLRSILGSGMSNKIWEATLEHARECPLGSKLYSYYIAECRVMLVLDSVFQVVGAKFDGYDYQPVSNLPPSQIALVNRLKQSAYGNRNDIIEVDVHAGVLSRHLTIMEAAVPGSNSHSLQCLDYYADALRDERSPQVSLEHLFVQPFHAEVPDDPAIQVKVQRFSSSLLNNSSRRGFLAEGSVSYRTEASSSGRAAATSEMLLSGSDYGSDAGTANYFPQTLTWEPGNGPFLATDSDVPHAYPSPAPGFSVHIPQSKWVKLMAALKCGMFIRRRVAAKRRAKYFGYPTNSPWLPKDF